jgi:hypothetical protein
MFFHDVKIYLPEQFVFPDAMIQFIELRIPTPVTFELPAAVQF